MVLVLLVDRFDLYVGMTKVCHVVINILNTGRFQKFLVGATILNIGEVHSIGCQNIKLTGIEIVVATAIPVDAVVGITGFVGLNVADDTVDDSGVMTVELVLGAYTVSQFVHG
jgi:hypothetical protein